MPFTPICRQGQLLIPDCPQDESLAIISLWTKREKIHKDIQSGKLSYNMPAVIGQLYSGTRGLDPLVRNLLANPQIKRLIITGQNLSKSAEALIRLFTTVSDRGDFDRVRKEFGLGPDITMDHIRMLADGIRVDVDATVDKGLPSLPAVAFYESRSAVILNAPQPTATGEIPGPSVGGLVRGSSIPELWLRMLDYIQRHGKVTGTHYDQRQKEVFSMTCVLDGDNPTTYGQTEWPDWLPMTGLTQYAYDLWEGTLPEGVAYTYGSLMRNGLAENDIAGQDKSSLCYVDQVEATVDKLIQDPDQRSAVIGLWQGRHSCTRSGTPCLNKVQFRVVDGKFHGSFSIRSNDMFGAWPMNIAGFRMFQERMLNRIRVMTGGTDNDQFWREDVSLGATITVSDSAHYYEDCWEAVDELVDRHFSAYCGLAGRPSDPFGNWVIEVVDDNAGAKAIRASLIDADDKVAKVFEGASADQLRKQIAPYMSEDSSHAIYIGSELAKAEMVAGLNLPYTQDQPLRTVFTSNAHRLGDN